MKKLVIGVLAHVDAGKTTLCEGLLHLSGAIKKPGRVDHGNAFLDTYLLERERGITIFSKQAILPFAEAEITLLDTPGHVDFSAEMERTLQVLDCAILVISGTDGIQGHTQTLWKLLKTYQVPVFLFVNKMDLAGADRQKIMQKLRARFGDGCIDFSEEARGAAFEESIAVTEDALLERYLLGQAVEAQDIARLVAKRSVFPCYFGAALRLEGVSQLVQGLLQNAPEPAYPSSFRARVYKISRDEQGVRLTHLKVTGGKLCVKDILAGQTQSGEKWKEKVNQIRIYSGAKFRVAEEVQAGTVCAVAGPMQTWSGMTFGTAEESAPPLLTPMLNYRLQLPETCDTHTMLKHLQQLEEEDPQLHIVWKESLAEIHVQIMGTVQLEVLKHLLDERFGVAVTFDAGSILYKETIAAPVIGVGHFEPLRHYAEVHLLMEPGSQGSGIQLSAACSTDVLDANWQRLILSHLKEREHAGVLTGAAVTDLKITLLAGRAHVKHTEGGDFRQATYRAVRQGLMQAQNVLLEPYYSFQLEVPQAVIGRALTDLQRMHGTVDMQDTKDGISVLTGEAPVSCLRDYWEEVAAYTKGNGHLFCTVKGYAPCHNEQEVRAAQGYDPERDVDNPADSVFCAHGAGYTVKWNQVAAQAHVSTGVRLNLPVQNVESPTRRVSAAENLDQELERIFVQTYGPIKNRSAGAFQQRRQPSASLEAEYLTRVRPDDYLLVDGYNIIFAWDELREIAADDLDAARSTLVHQLSSYQQMKRCKVIVVFDAYKVKGNAGGTEDQYNIKTVYTKEAETADMYIERASYELSRNHRVKVATSDALEQMIILGHGAERMSATELEWEVEQAKQQMSDLIKRHS